jgi:hypothetical protein
MEQWNSYRVTFVFNYTTISTTVSAPSEDACENVASDMIYEDLGYSKLSSILTSAQDVVVELLEENVRMEMV